MVEQVLVAAETPLQPLLLLLVQVGHTFVVDKPVKNQKQSYEDFVILTIHIGT